MFSRNRLIIVTLVLLAYLPPALHHRKLGGGSTRRAFLLPVLPPASSALPSFKTELIAPAPLVPSAHVASLCELPDGTLCAAWYGGSHEGARDVNIYWSKRAQDPANSWSAPEVLVSRASAMRELRRPIKKLGNAVLFANGEAQLHLIYVTVSIGGWSTSSLNVKTSRDSGRTWLSSQRLTLSPFFNLSELVKNKPCALSDGGWAVPIYHECLGKFPEILWIKQDPAGELSWRKSRIRGGRSALQPALVPLSKDAAIALCRDCTSTRRIRLASSSDAGQSWSPLQPIDLPNSDSGLDAVRLSDGRILVAFNDSPAGRDNLRLAVSVDAGLTWSRSGTLENQPGAEFSYPSLLQTKDGHIHMVYTWKRKAIKHAAFNLAWLDAQRNSAAILDPRRDHELEAPVFGRSLQRVALHPRD